MITSDQRKGIEKRTRNFDTRRRNRSSSSRPHWFCGIVAFMLCQRLPTISCLGGDGRKLQRYSIDYKNPSLHWMTRLEEDYLFHGNAIVKSPYNSEHLYVTTHSGKLMVLSMNDGSTVSTVSISPRVETEDGGTEPWTMHCNSGVSFGTLTSGGKFLVFSVQDTPPEGSVHGPATRIVAVSIPSHEVLWTSAGQPGLTNGSPLVYENQGDSNSYIFFTHNSHFKSDIDNSTTTAGHVTLLETTSGHIIWTDSEWSGGVTPKGYSPPGIAKAPNMGMFSGGEGNSNDVIMWSNSDKDGRGSQGFTFAFQLPIDYTGTGDQVELLRTEPLKVVRWNAVVAPVFSQEGTELFMGVGRSEVRGWVGGKLFDATATWSSKLIETDTDPMAPVPTTPTLSVDETRLFVSSAKTDIVCLDTRTGEKKWDVRGTSPFLARSKISPDDERLYIIQSVDGRVFSHDQRTGDLKWLASCDQFEEDCANAVRADFEVSHTGQFLIYGDVLGRIIALRLGDLVEDFEPTVAPGTGVLDPSETTIWPEDCGQQGKKPRSGVALGVSTFLIILATIVAIASVSYIVFMNGLKTAPHPMQEPHLPEGDTDAAISDYSLPCDLDNAPDKYEDIMISQHKAPLKSILPIQILPSTKDKSWKSVEGPFDNISLAPADRISLLLGTSNRIAPIQEDFSYGAAVLV